MSDAYSHDLSLSTFNEAFADVQPVLSACWIESLSEFLGALGALRRLEKKPLFTLQAEGALSLLDERPPFDSPEDWASYKAFWSEDADAESRASNVQVVNFTPRDPAKRKPYSVSTPLPQNYALKFPNVPIRNQEESSSCAAHAVASAIEYCVGKEIDAETTQTLFDESRRRDGIGGNGTLLSATLTTARKLKFWRGERVLEPGAVALWKAALVGVDDAAPSPIIASFATYPSWLYSKASRLSGKWTLPLPEEPCVGFHAALVVGYQDDPSAPGGGFFVVRNSWGKEYACQSPIKAPGCALVPYGYVQRCCVEAYVVSNEYASVGAGGKTYDFETKFVRVLEEDAREFRTRTPVKSGTRVVAHPDEPGVFLPYSSDTRAEFEANGYAWTRERRVLNYFPAVDAETQKGVEARYAASLRFANDLRTNLKALVGVESPFSPGGFWSRVRRFRAVEEIADLSDAVRTKLARRNGLHNDLDCAKDAPDAWKSAIQASSLVKIWRVDDGKKAFAVVGIWLAPLCFLPLEAPKFVAPTAETLNIALEVVDEWKSNSARDFEAICESFGTFDGLWVGLEGVARRGSYVLSTFEPDERGGRWRAAPCETFVDERMRRLVRAWNPTAFEDAVSYVRSVLERESLVFFGDFTVELVALKSGESQSKVEAALDELVKNGTYETYQTARGEKAYRKKR